MGVPGFNTQQRNKLDSIGVESVYLFGSRAMGREGPLSDYDYAVLLDEKGHQRGDALYMDLYELFGAVSPRRLENDVIDIVFLRDARLELRFHVVRYGLVLHDKNPRARLDFEQETTMLYCDYRPILDEFDRALTASL